MTEIGQVYKCNNCGNVVEVLDAGVGELACCNQPMEELIAQKDGDKAPKHLPVVEITGDEVTVKVGEVQHPMEDEHSIRFIELIVGEERFIKNLKPGDISEATFTVGKELIDNNNVVAREFCNLHGLWQA